MDLEREKPTGSKAGWQLRASATRFENEICRLREDEVELAEGKRTRYVYLERDEAVVVVPVTHGGRIVLIRQYRYPVDEWCMEVPAGGTHDAGDASLEDVVRKELHQEIGATVQSVTRVGYFHSANALTDEKCHVFLAEGVELSKKPEKEATETLQTKLVPANEAVEMARRGEMKTGPCALAVLMCEPLLRERGYLNSL